MPIRAKLKKTFGSKKNGSGDSTPSGTSPPLRKDIEYYKPHEIPKSKYRGKVDKEHQERLDAYSFADAFGSAPRRASQALSGTFSPGGTHAQSAAQTRRSSWQSRNPSSLSTTNTSLNSSLDSRDKSLASTSTPGGYTQEYDLSKIDTSAGPLPLANHQMIPELRLEKTITQGGPPSSPTISFFTAEELEQAMNRASLRPRRGTVLPSAMQLETVAGAA